METAGAASAATLGYIIGNLPGAYYGYQAYRAYRAMPPIPRKRKYTGPSKFNRVFKKARRMSRYSTNITTAQKDYGNQYRKKRMPRYKKKAWKKFSNKVKAVNIKSKGLKTVVFNESASSVASDQNFMALHLYGGRGTPGAAGSPGTIGAGDLNRMFANDPSVVQGTGPLNARIGKLVFGSAVIDITMHNIGELDAEVDIYYCYHRKDVISENLDRNFGTGSGSLQEPIQSGNVTLDLYQRGVTPFDCSTSLSESGLTVLKKQKLFLRTTQTAFIQHRDAQNHVLEWNRLKQTGYAVRKLTYTILVIHKPVTGSEGTSHIAFGCTRKYSYVEDAETVDASGLNV